MELECIHYEIKDKVAIIELYRPPFNPINTQLFNELKMLLLSLEDNNDIRVIVITGSGHKAFCAGADLKEVQRLNASEMLHMTEVSHDTLATIESIGKPVIAAINGLALGGGTEIALACDFRICTDNSKLGLPEITLGLIPGAGGTQRLQRLIGQARAKELMFVGEVIDAKKAKDIGLVNDVVDESQLEEEVMNFAYKLASRAPVAMHWLKKSVNNGGGSDLPTALKLEISYFMNVYASEDCEEGMLSFIEKRKPNFVGK